LVDAKLYHPLKAVISLTDATHKMANTADQVEELLLTARARWLLDLVDGTDDLLI